MGEMEKTEAPISDTPEPETSVVEGATVSDTTSGISGVKEGMDVGRRPSKPLSKPVYRTFSEDELKPNLTDEQVEGLKAAIRAEAQAEIASAGRKRPSRKKPVLIAAALLVAAFLVFQARYTLAGLVSPRAYLAVTGGKTVAALRQEIHRFRQNNPVLKKYGEILQKPSQHDASVEAQVPGFGSMLVDIKAQNDNQRKQLKVSTTVPFAGEVAVYLSDQEGVASFMHKDFSFNPKDANSELSVFIENNHLSVNEEDIPPKLDISYSALEEFVKTLDPSTITGGQTKLAERYQKEFIRLWDTGVFINAPREEIEFGGKFVKAKAVTATFKEAYVQDWLFDMAVAIQDDTELMMALGDFLYNPLKSFARDLSASYSGDLTITFLAYRNQVRAVRLEQEGGQRFLAEWGVAGQAHMLDSIYANVKADGSTFSFKAEGNHIGKGMFTSKASYRDPYSAGTMQLQWDPAQKRDNFSIRASGMDEFVLTLAVDGDRCIAALNSDALFDKDMNTFTYTAQPLRDKIKWPEETEPLAGLNIQQMITGMFSFFQQR